MCAAGRPSKFKEEFIEQARILAERGFTEREIAEFLNVTERTIANWKKRYEEFFQVLKVAKEHADERVERALYERAVGYKHDEEKLFSYEGEIIRAEVTKHYPPDVSAATFWLSNRRKDQWKNHSQHAHSGADGGPIEVKELSDVEYARRTTFLLRSAQRRGAGGAQGPDAGADEAPDVDPESGPTD